MRQRKGKLMSPDLIKAIEDLKEEESISLARKLLDGGEAPSEILDAAREAMERIGKHFEDNLYFLPELMMAGEIMKQISELVSPHLLTEKDSKRKGKIVFGTVEGDIHNIGKDIVTVLLDAIGFEVIDMGVDVAPEKFIEKLKEVEAPILGLSGFLYFSHQSMKKTIDLLEKEGMRRKVKVMIGGGQVDERVMKMTGADGWGRDAMDAVNIAKKWMEEAPAYGN
jgi:methanogenic corrinoid protein MtbC1